MTPEVRDRIFEPFFSTKGEGRGTGLGLATAYGIIRNYGGNIEVESEIGKGTRVEVFLPAQQGQSESANEGKSSFRTAFVGAVGQGKCILIAEDQRLVRRHTCRILRRWGLEVIEAEDGVEAVEAIKMAQRPISLAMLDLQMPRRSGDEACRMIRALDADLPILMVSGNVEDPRIESLSELSNIGVLSKPYGSQELADALGRAR